MTKFWTQLETALASGAARGADQLAPHATGGLKYAAEHLLAPGGAVALITGFYVAQAQPPAAETDGPLATLAIAEALIGMGRPVVVLTDAPCAPVLHALADEANLPAETVLIADADMDLILALKTRDVDTVFAIERPGQAPDGRCYSMRGRDLSAVTLAFDPLFAPDSGFIRLAAGDGGNEIGMGRIPASIIAETVDQGAKIACTTSSDALIVTGVSHWTAYALAAAAQAIAPDHAALWRAIVHPERETARMQAALNAGAVDGVTAQPNPTIDGLDLPHHWAQARQLLDLGAAHASTGTVRHTD